MATNSVTLIGNLVEDPELRFTPSGVAMARIRVAVNRRWRDQSGEWQEQTSFFGGTLWREAAENVAESLQKGARVIIAGSLEQRQWETQDGDKRSGGGRRNHQNRPGRRASHRRNRPVAPLGNRLSHQDCTRRR
jgi:single stranded DNA-binding protein